MAALTGRGTHASTRRRRGLAVGAPVTRGEAHAQARMDRSRWDRAVMRAGPGFPHRRRTRVKRLPPPVGNFSGAAVSSLTSEETNQRS